MGRPKTTPETGPLGKDVGTAVQTDRLPVASENSIGGRGCFVSRGYHGGTRKDIRILLCLTASEDTFYPLRTDVN